MTTAAEEIASLDAEIASRFQMVTFRRETGGAPLSTEKQAVVRRADPEMLAAGISQDARRVIVSVTGLDAWSPLPEKGDWLRIGSGAYAVIESVEIIEVMGVPVRINIIVMDAG